MGKIILTLVFLVSMIAGGFAQEKLKIGEVVDGKLKITNESALRAFFMNNTGRSGSLDKVIRTEVSPTADRIFVYQKVSGNKTGITSIGVMLIAIGNEAFIVAGDPENPVSGPGIGGSVTVSCIGNPCTQCVPIIEWVGGNWLPIIICDCLNPDGHCNQTISVTLDVNVGL